MMKSRPQTSGFRPRAAAVAALFLTGCTFHSTDSTEVGVLTRKIAIFGKAGVQQETYPPGATYTFPAFITDWHVYNVALQNLGMVQSKTEGDRAERDARSEEHTS